MSVRLELSDLPPRIRAQAEAQIAARGQKKASAAPSMAGQALPKPQAWNLTPAASITTTWA